MSINKLKIYGERNSGTNYMEQLIRHNYRNLHILDNYFVGSGGTGWKHGIPYPNRYDKDSTLIIVVFRDLNDWLLSMYYNSYHLRSIPTFGTGDFNTFIKTKFFGLQYNMLEYYPFSYNPTEEDKICFNFERNKDMFDVRYSKYEEYMKLTETNNVAFVKLEFLQKKPDIILRELDKIFGLSKYRINEPFINVTKHTKTQKNEKNRTYDKNILDQEFVDNHKDINIEERIDIMTLTCYKQLQTNIESIC